MWVGCHGVHAGWGGQSPGSGCQIPPVLQTMCPNQLHKPLGVGWDLLDKSLTLKQEGSTHPLASCVSPPALSPAGATCDVWGRGKGISRVSCARRR